METDYDFSSALHATDLDDPEKIGRTAGEKAVAKLNPRKVSTRKVPVVFDWSIAVAWFIAAVWLLFWLGNLALPDRVEFLLPWRRKRMQRDFSTMFSLLLDAGVPEARALRLGAECAANSGFLERAQRAAAELQQGAKLPDAARRLDDAGEFAWRLRNAAAPGGSFFAALEGWHEALDAKAFQQQQTASQLVTTGFVMLNGVMVSLVALGLFRLLLAILDEAAL